MHFFKKNTHTHTPLSSFLTVSFLALTHVLLPLSPSSESGTHSSSKNKMTSYHMKVKDRNYRGEWDELNCFGWQNNPLITWKPCDWLATCRKSSPPFEPMTAGIISTPPRSCMGQVLRKWMLWNIQSYLYLLY